MRIEKNNYTLNFHAGLTKQIQKEIATCNTKKISAEFSKFNIPTDFRNNKTVAWCSLKCFEIIQNLNKQFNLNLALPTGIFVEDFKKLNILSQDASGSCSIFPTKLYKDSEIIIPEKTIFFNENPDDPNYKGSLYWENIDLCSDISKNSHLAPTDFFLNTFLHEFSHVIHIGHLIKSMGRENFLKVFNKINNPAAISQFKNKYWLLMFENLCTYASSHPMEAVACDFSKRIAEHLNKDTFLIKDDFIKNSPYRKYSVIDTILSPLKYSEYNHTIRQFWNGNFK